MLELLGRILIVAMCAVVALIVGLIATGMIEHVIGARRRRAVAERSRCEVCGAPLGRPAIDLADRTCDVGYGSRDRPGADVRYQRVRLTFAICVQCGAHHGYDPARRAFHLLPREGPP